MLSTITGFFYAWILTQTFMGLLIRKIYPFARADGSRIAVWLAIQALTGAILLVAFILSRKGLLDALGKLLTKSWGF